MGHRKEVFKPRKGKRKIAPRVKKELDENNFDGAVQTALSNYIDKSTADTFSASLLATAEAFIIANNQNWTRPIEEVSYLAIKNTETKRDISLSKFERQTIFNIVSRTLRKQFLLGGGRD